MNPSPAPLAGANHGRQHRRGWDVAVAAAILAVVLLGWLTAAGGSHTGAPRPAHSVAHAAGGHLRR